MNDHALTPTGTRRIPLMIVVLQAFLLPGGAPTTPVLSSAESVREESHQKPESDSVRNLEVGRPIARDISGGQVHSYTIAMSPGNYARVLVHQRGIDLVIVLVGPDGKAVVTQDGFNGSWGPEEIQLLSQSTEPYRIEVRSLDRHAATARYEVEIAEMRPGTPQDETRMLAQQAYAEAEAFLAEDTAESIRRAIEKYGKSLSLRRAVGDLRQQALRLLDIGGAYNRLGEGRRALHPLNEALTVIRTLGDDGETASALNLVGVVHYGLDEHQKAIEYHRESLSLRAPGDRPGVAFSLSNLGIDFFAFGEEERALDSFNEALAIFRSVGNQYGEAYVLTHLGVVHTLRGEHRKALDYLSEALPHRRAVADRFGEGMTLRRIGDVYDALGEKERALDYYGQSLSLRRTVGDRAGEAKTLSSIGSLYMQFGERQKALDYLKLALAIQREIGDRSGEAQTLSEIAHAERDRGNLIEARRQLEAAFEIFDSLKNRLGSRELRASYSSVVRRSYEAYIELLMRLHLREPSEGFDIRALNVSERARARNLLELLAESQVDIRHGVDPSLIDQERALQQLLSAKLDGQIRLLSGKHSSEQAAEATREIDTLKAEYEQLDVRIRVASPHYAALIRPQSLTLPEVQKEVVDRDTLLLEYALGDERSFLWAVGWNSMSVHELPRRAELDTAARRFYELVTARNRDVPFEAPEVRRDRVARADAEQPEAAAALSRMILGPVARQLGAKRLAVVADGALQYVPFVALPVPGDSALLGVGREIVSLPSASVLAVLRRELAGRLPPAKTLAVFADPVFDLSDERVKSQSALAGNAKKATPPARSKSALNRSAKDIGLDAGAGEVRIPRLPFTRREAKAILSLVPERLRREALDFEANRSSATDPDLSHYRYIHFATHGFLNARHPELSGIVLSLVDREGREQEGFLPVLEVLNLKLSADLVVLSGCRTGLGKEIRGEGLVGLTRGFMYAGAARVIVSLWDVPDEATAELMARLYKGILGKDHLSPVSALRAAQMSLRKENRWNQPYYWAGFVIQGEPR